MDTMLKLDKVSKFYSSHGVVAAGFSKVSLDFSIGEFVAVTGESGSGKSTLMNVISGLDSYEEGELYIFGEPTSGYSEDEKEEYRKKYIGNIFQTFNLINSYTVYQNVELILLLSGFNRNEVKEKVDEIIDKVNLTEYRNTKVSKLSGGQKQRVAIARALAHDTPVIVADEPTGNLDVKAAAEIIQLLHKLSEDKLIIIVTHNYDQVEDYVTRKITMHDGKVIEDKKVNNKSSNSDTYDVNNDKTQNSEKITNNTLSNDDVKSTEEIRSATVRKGTLTNGSTVRLGVRNTFAIPSKFVLLFVVFFLLCAGTFSAYSSFKASENTALSSVFSNFFQDSSPERLVVAKENGEEITDKDFAKLEKISNIKSVDKDDFLRDSNVMLTDGHDGQVNLDLIAQPESQVNGKITEGNPAEKGISGVLYIKAKDQFSIEQAKKAIGKELFNDSEVQYDDNMNPINMDQVQKILITGVGQLDSDGEKRLNSSAMPRDGIIGLSPEAVKILEEKKIREGCSQEVALGTVDLINDGLSGEAVPLTPSKSVNEGTVLIPDDFKNYYKNGNVWNQNVTITNKSKYFTDKYQFKIAGVYTKYTLKPYFGIGNYQDGQKNIYMNPNDYNKMFQKGKYQCSLFMENTALTDETVKAVKAEGYKVLPVNQAAGSSGEAMRTAQRIFLTAVLAIMLIVYFFISYFIIRLILKSRNGYFTTIRMIGARKNNCYTLMGIDLFCVFNIAYFAYVLAVNTVMPLIPSVAEKLVQYRSYVHTGDYVILYVILMAMSLLISKRYSSRMFKQTAMNAYKEEV